MECNDNVDLHFHAGKRMDGKRECNSTKHEDAKQVAGTYCGSAPLAAMQVEPLLPPSSSHLPPPSFRTANTCADAASEQTQRRAAVASNAIAHTLAGREPRRNVLSLRPLGSAKTRTMVPVADAVASSVPSALSARHRMGASCARIELSV